MRGFRCAGEASAQALSLGRCLLAPPRGRAQGGKANAANSPQARDAGVLQNDVRKGGAKHCGDFTVGGVPPRECEMFRIGIGVVRQR